MLTQTIGFSELVQTSQLSLEVFIASENSFEQPIVYVEGEPQDEWSETHLPDGGSFEDPIDNH